MPEITEVQASQWLAEKMVEQTADVTDFMFRSVGKCGHNEFGKTWGFTLGCLRDSSKSERRSFEAAEKRLMKKHPGDVENVRNSHWACGYIDQTLVRLLEDDGKLTPAAVSVVAEIAKQEKRKLGHLVANVVEAALQVEMRCGKLKRPNLAPASLWDTMRAPVPA